MTARLEQAGGTLIKISEVLPIGVAQASFQFANIPQGYRKLSVEILARGTAVATSSLLQLQCNGDVGNNYQYSYVLSTGAAASSSNGLAQVSFLCGSVSAASAPAGAAGYCVIDIPLYANIIYRKRITTRNSYVLADSAANMNILESMGDWKNTSAISSILIFLSSGNFDVNSTAILYGIL